MKNKTNIQKQRQELIIYIDGVLQPKPKVPTTEILKSNVLTLTGAISQALSNARLNIADELELALIDAKNGSSLRNEMHNQRRLHNIQLMKERFGIK